MPPLCLWDVRTARYTRAMPQITHAQQKRGNGLSLNPDKPGLTSIGQRHWGQLLFTRQLNVQPAAKKHNQRSRKLSLTSKTDSKH